MQVRAGYTQHTHSQLCVCTHISPRSPVRGKCVFCEFFFLLLRLRNTHTSDVYVRSLWFFFFIVGIFWMFLLRFGELNVCRHVSIFLLIPKSPQVNDEDMGYWTHYIHTHLPLTMCVYYTFQRSFQYCKCNINFVPISANYTHCVSPLDLIDAKIKHQSRVESDELNSHESFQISELNLFVLDCVLPLDGLVLL